MPLTYGRCGAPGFARRIISVSALLSDAQLAAVARQDLPGLIARLRQLLCVERCLRSLMGESVGLARYHLNGEIVPWADLGASLFGDGLR